MIERTPAGRFVRGGLAPAVYFVTLTVMLTWPLARSLGSSIAGQFGDNLYFIWLIGWIPRALFVLHQ